MKYVSTSSSRIQNVLFSSLLRIPVRVPAVPCVSTRSTPHSRGATLSRPLVQSSRRGTGRVGRSEIIGKPSPAPWFGSFLLSVRLGVREVAHISTPDELITPSCRLHALPT